MSETPEQLEQAKQYLAELEPEFKITQVTDNTRYLTELPKGAKHWHMVIVKKDDGDTRGWYAIPDMKGYQVFCYNGRFVALCENIGWVDFQDVRKKLCV